MRSDREKPPKRTDGDANLKCGQGPGDILLFCGARGQSRLITLLTRSPYYHVAICQDTFHVVEARPGGVISRDLRLRRGGHEFVVIPAPKQKGAEALKWAQGKIGDKYDALDILAIPFLRVFGSLRIKFRPPTNRFSCGEFVARAFQEVGVRLFPDLDYDDVIPADFARLLPTAKSGGREKTVVK